MTTTTTVPSREVRAAVLDAIRSMPSRYRAIDVADELEMDWNQHDPDQCGSIGPRIGSEGSPRCRLGRDHEGWHRPSPSDGWGDVTWAR